MLTPVDVAVEVAKKATEIQSGVAAVMTRHVHDRLTNEVSTLYALVENVLHFQMESGTLNDHQRRRCYRLMKRIKAHRQDLSEEIQTGKRSAFEAALKELRELREVRSDSADSST